VNRRATASESRTGSHCRGSTMAIDPTGKSIRWVWAATSAPAGRAFSMRGTTPHHDSGLIRTTCGAILQRADAPQTLSSDTLAALSLGNARTGRGSTSLARSLAALSRPTHNHGHSIRWVSTNQGHCSHLAIKVAVFLSSHIPTWRQKSRCPSLERVIIVKPSGSESSPGCSYLLLRVGRG